MILFPAIDLKDGKCVRLQQGEMERVTVFNQDPVAQALVFQSEGVEWIHVVDLNGAFEGRPVNLKEVVAIRRGVDVSIQLGGGIREMATAESWINIGIERIVLGTAALRNPEFVKEACKEFPSKVAVGIDAKDGKVAVEGWSETSDMEVVDLARSFEDAGVAAIIYTNIDRDGMMVGPDVAGTQNLAESVHIPIIASGGVSSLNDLKILKKVEKSGIEGVICGRAMYEGEINISQALEVLSA
jgi:phosphoribosylformimino-5-aminoimidazole carboxamide ribotide isomerase